MQAVFVNAQKEALKYPDSFEAPSREELSEVRVGSFVKVCTEGERFWAIVKDVSGQAVKAEVNNDLIRTPVHGLSCGDEIEFDLDDIYAIWHGK